MVHIIYPRTDLNDHDDLKAWLETPEEDKDWKTLRAYLAQHTYPTFNMEYVHKCWYTEVYQYDINVIDIEHFRPKNSAKPLSKKLKKKVEKILEFPIYQRNDESDYKWLEYDHRNYRLTTGRPNRLGAKQDYFPLAKNSPRLVEPELPWEHPEYCFLLDPVDLADTELLTVLPDGEIMPSIPKTVLPEAAYDDLEANWRTDGFGYVRAWITIVLYKLDDANFKRGRKSQFNKMEEDIDELYEAVTTGNDLAIRNASKKILSAMLPSAQFALASRCALEAYKIPAGNAGETLRELLERLKNKAIGTIADTLKSWDMPS